MKKKKNFNQNWMIKSQNLVQKEYTSILIKYKIINCVSN